MNGNEAMNTHARVRVRSGERWRPGEVWGYAGPTDAPTRYYVHYTDVERPEHIVTVNSVEYPEGYSGYFSAEDVEFL